MLPETTLVPSICSNVNHFAEGNFHWQDHNDLNHVLPLLTASVGWQQFVRQCLFCYSLGAIQIRRRPSQPIGSKYQRVDRFWHIMRFRSICPTPVGAH